MKLIKQKTGYRNTLIEEIYEIITDFFCLLNAGSCI